MVNLRQKIAFQKVMESNGEKPIGQAMLEAGYAPSTANTPKVLTGSKAWQELIDKVLSDDKLAKKHDDLLNASGIDQFVFDISDDDETIAAVIESVPGVKLLRIRVDDMKKKAYVRVPDNQSQRAALDMAYKLKGNYAPEKSMNVNVTIDPEQAATLIEMASGLGKVIKTSYGNKPTDPGKTSGT